MNKIKDKLVRREQITMTDIREHKRLILGQIKEQQDVLKNKTEQIFAPITDTSSSLLSSFNLGMAAFDTFLVAFKALRGLGRIFRRKRH